MRLSLATLFVAAGISCCCGDIPAMLGLNTPKEPDIAPPEPVAEATPVPEPVVEAPKPAGPTTIASLSASTDACELKVETLGGESRVLSALPSPCPAAASLVVHPDGGKLLVTEPSGITLVDVATGKPTRLDALEGLVAVGWDPAGTPVALTSAVAEVKSDATGKFVMSDGERLALGPDADNAVEVSVGRVYALEGIAWKKARQVVGIGFEGMTEEDMYRNELTTWARKDPSSRLDIEKDLGKVLTENTPGPGEWRQDGVLAFQFEWLEGVMAHGPAALRLPDGTWKSLAGFETGALTWTERQDVLWLTAGEGKSAVFDVKSGETKWESMAPAWLLPLDLTLAARTEPAVEVAAPPPVAEPKAPSATGSRRTQPKGKGDTVTTAAPPPPPPAKPVVEEEDEKPVYEPPPDLDEEPADMKRKRGGGKKKKDKEKNGN